MQIFSGSPTLNYCIAVFVFRSFMVSSGAALVEMGLLMRVVALYNSNKLVAYTLISFHLICLGLQLVGQGRVIFTSITATTQCHPAGSERPNLILLGVGVGMSQACFFVMTAYKLIAEKMLKTRLAGLVLREAICMFILLTVMLSSVALYESFRSGRHFSVDVSELLFVLYILALSLVAPRLTLHIRKVAMDEAAYGVSSSLPQSSRKPYDGTKAPTTICLTSYIE
ncbi:hypothetical protein BJ165DRAFT_1523207 [Panaeolus papilionaceus]|nr:hypothetical protein BJ165DRAFT_1523207 [Panaeolus papilionaceus]